MQLSHKYLSNLTPLRGLAALWVVAFHFQATFMLYVPPGSTYLISKGYIMVDLFFIMSGFIIYHVYKESFESGFSAKNFREFTVARFARVYPLHFITLILCIVLFVPKWGWDAVDDPKAIITNLLLIHSFGIHKIFTWNVPSWSISAEWWSYMVFPFIAIFLYQKKQMAVLILLTFVVLAYMGIIYWIPRKSYMDPTKLAEHNLDSTFDFGFLRGLAGFVTGILVYKVYQAGLLRKIFQQDITAILVILITLVSLHFGLSDGLCIVLFALVVFTFAQSNRFLHQICNNRLAQYLGNISYSIYLVQFFPLVPFFYWNIKLPGVVYPKDAQPYTSFWRGAGYLLIYMILLIGFSSLTYYFIEKPCRKYINRRWGKQQMPVYA
jgi:peptidoglycan/LPS O-acetylase OafA/YrhL